jgi:hypothetical protein
MRGGRVWQACACLLAFAAPPARAATLQELISGASLDAGAARFRDWQLVGFDATALPPSLADIAVLPLVDDLAHPGIQFLSNGPLATAGVNSLDLVFKFRIDVLAGGKSFTGQSLEMPGILFGGAAGIATVSQETSSVGGTNLAASVVIADKGANVFQTQSAASFAPRASVLATANVFVTGLAAADTVNLTQFRIRVAQTGCVPVAGDFDGDGDVDAIDLAQWKGDFALNDDSDADVDGDSDGADFLAWQQNLGATSPGAALAAGAVPEPAAGALASAAMLIILAARRRKPGTQATLQAAAT